jgi:hypothetical protein
MAVARVSRKAELITNKKRNQNLLIAFFIVCRLSFHYDVTLVKFTFSRAKALHFGACQLF